MENNSLKRWRGLKGSCKQKKNRNRQKLKKINKKLHKNQEKTLNKKRKKRCILNYFNQIYNKFPQ